MALTTTRRELDADGIAGVLRAAEQAAADKGFRVVIAVVDAGGELLELRRVHDAQVASSRVAIDKARTAAIFVRPSRDIEEQVSAGRLGALSLHGARALTGGIPLRVGDEVVGAIGTSGETPDEDEYVSIVGAEAELSTREVPKLTREGARLAAEAAGLIADERKVWPVISIVDPNGELLYLRRPDRAQVASVGVATDKARTASIYRRPSKDFEDQATSGRPSALHLARAVPLQGGMPIVVDGHVVGAIGVSGATSADEDQELAVAGTEAFGAALAAEDGPGVGEATFFAAGEVRARFQTGGLLQDAPSFKIDAGRRTGPGEVEWHARETDIMYVVGGEATVVTGGELVNVREVAPGELRAERSEGDTTTHRLTPGDVLAIPAKVPHHFTEATDPFLYYVVKVVHGGAGGV